MPQTEQATKTYRAVAALSRPVVRYGVRLRAQGVERLPRGGFVLCANHLSALDGWALGVPLYPRQPRFMTKAIYFRPPLRALFTRLGIFPVWPERCCVQAIKTGIAHARAGRVVVVFPEGIRRKKARPDRPHARAGAAHIALAAGVPLVPAAIVGTEYLTDAPWRVAFGRPVPVEDLEGLPRRIAAREATRRLWREIESLQEALR